MTGFKVLLYHEFVKKADFNESDSYPIHVKQGYEDFLPHRLFTYVEDFEEQMKVLYESGYHTLTLQEIYDFYYENQPLPEKSVLLTFDDLFVSVYDYAYPILKKYGFHAVGFLVREWLFENQTVANGRKVVCMGMEQVEQMKDVFEYANHTSTMHMKRFTEEKQMITAIQETSKEQFFMDLEACEEIVDYKGAFAYPFGAYTKDNVSWLEEKGYRLAFTCHTGSNDKEISPLCLRRDEVRLGISLEQFKQLVEGE